MFFLMITLGVSASASAQSGDRLTITTYYPSPYGVYGTLKLHPRPKSAQPCREGEMVYDAPVDPAAPRGLYVCNATSQWQIVSGSSGGLWSENATNNAVYVTNQARNVGIGTLTPQAPLDVNGTVRAGPAGQRALGTGFATSLSFDDLRDYHINIPLPFPSTSVATTQNICDTIAACNRYCGAGCSLATSAQCNGDQPGLGYHGGTAVEWDYTTQRAVCVCF